MASDNRRKHPGKGRVPGRYEGRGRQVDPAARDEVRAVLGHRARARELLIEHLHLIQDHYHGISARHIAALAEEMRLSQAEVYEVATFYAHFDVVADGEAYPPPLTIRVCDSVACAMQNADTLYAELLASVDDDVRVVTAPCMGRCQSAPAAMVGQRAVDHATTEATTTLFDAGQFQAEIPDYENLAAYRERGGYKLLDACLHDRHTRDGVIDTIDAAGLRGMGGAGFPCGRKWRLVRDHPEPRFMAVNADEGEPGTFKDRYFLESCPHRVLEGMLIAAWAIDACEIYFYLRDEYPAVRHILQREIQALLDAGLTHGFNIHLRRGAGAYICGEESAMLESIEGKRGEPRHKPPYPAEVGLFGRPTLIHNVETLFWVPEILERGVEWYADQGRRGAKGPRAFSVSGRVRDPGVKIAPSGITVRELIDEHCGGMADGHTFKGYLPGGASGGILPASMDDLALDFGTLDAHGCFIGSAAVVVLSDQDDIRAIAQNLVRFFEHESCGQCTPCRVGTEKAAALMVHAKWDEPLLNELCAAMADASICGLGFAAPNPLLSAFRYFREDLG